jgi:hypothetical protein
MYGVVHVSFVATLIALGGWLVDGSVMVHSASRVLIVTLLTQKTLPPCFGANASVPHSYRRHSAAGRASRHHPRRQTAVCGGQLTPCPRTLRATMTAAAAPLSWNASASRATTTSRCQRVESRSRAAFSSAFGAPGRGLSRGIRRGMSQLTFQTAWPPRDASVTLCVLQLLVCSV